MKALVLSGGAPPLGSPDEATPTFLLRGHALEPRPVFADVPMTTGHARRRRVSSTAPRVAEVGWFLTQGLMTTVDAWFESTLLVGSRKFSAPVKNQGAGLLWWEAQWLEPYTAEPVSRGRWYVSGKLLLTGEGSTTPPVLSTLGVEFGAALTGSASLTVGALLGVEFGAALMQPVDLAVEFGAALRQVGNFRLREDSSYTLREGGGRRIREPD